MHDHEQPYATSGDVADGDRRQPHRVDRRDRDHARRRASVLIRRPGHRKVAI